MSLSALRAVTRNECPEIGLDDAIASRAARSCNAVRLSGLDEDANPADLRGVIRPIAFALALILLTCWGCMTPAKQAGYAEGASLGYVPCERAGISVPTGSYTSSLSGANWTAMCAGERYACSQQAVIGSQLRTACIKVATSTVP